MKPVYILESIRTPVCRARRGGLATVRPDDLAALILKELAARAGVDPGEIDDIILGCAMPEAEQGMNVARLAQFKSGIPYQVPAMTVNRFCSSGLQTMSLAADRIASGQAHCIIAGGTESMTMVPMGGNKFSANPEMAADYPEAYTSMGITAEIVAERFDISREDQDRFALASHQHAAAAIKEGRFTDEIIPVNVERITPVAGGKVKREEVVVDQDDGVRFDTSLEALGKLRPAFKKDGTVTAGNSSQMSDGAAAALVVSEEFVKRVGGSPLARFVGYDVRGVPPEIMGIGPTVAVPAVLKRTGLKLEDISLVELNEAFAAQSVYCVRELGLDADIVNVNGGAIALGHPLGCTGAKLTATLLHEMRRRDVRYGIVTMCVGEGMGAAGVFEKM